MTTLPPDIAALRKLAEGLRYDADHGNAGVIAPGVRKAANEIDTLLDALEAAKSDILRMVELQRASTALGKEMNDALEAAQRERDEARAALKLYDEPPTDLPPLTPEEEIRHAALREVVVEPDLVPRLRAELAQAIHDRDKYWKDAEEAEQDKAQMVKEIDEAIEVKVLLSQQCEEAEAKLVTACDDVRFFEARLAAARAEVEALRADSKTISELEEWLRAEDWRFIEASMVVGEGEIHVNLDADAASPLGSKTVAEAAESTFVAAVRAALDAARARWEKK